MSHEAAHLAPMETPDALHKKLEIARNNAIASQKEFQRLKEALSEADFSADPMIPRIVSNMLRAASQGNRQEFMTVAQKAYLYARKTIGQTKRTLHEAAIDEAGQSFGIQLPKDFGFKNIWLPAGLPSFVGGSAGHGKTSWLLNLVRAFREQGIKKGLIVSLEMTAGQFVNRLVAQEVFSVENNSMGWQESYEYIQKGYATDFLEKEVEPYIHIKDRAPGETFTIEDFLQYHEWYVNRYGEPEYVALDYMQKLSRQPKQNKFEAIEKAIYSLTDYAKGTSYPWINLAQNNRDAFKSTAHGAADLTAFEGSAGFEQDAGIGLTLGRHYGPPDIEYDILENRIVKNRKGASGIRSYVRIHKETGTLMGTTSSDEIKEWVKRRKAEEKGKE